MAEGEKIPTIEIKFETSELQSYFDFANSDELIEATESDEQDDAGIYFVDESGKYFYQAAKDSDTVEADFAAAENGNSDREKKKKNSINSKNVDKNTNIEDEDSASFVLVMENNETEDNDEEREDGEDENRKIFEFDENEELRCKTDKTEIPKYMVRIKKSLSKSKDSHQCSHCEYVTTRRYMLARHMKCHSEDRPYKCSVCERGFKTAPSLQNHANTHTGTKPHSCKDCDASFTTSGELVRHIRYRHTHEKPHKCTECDYSSVEMSKLKRHIRCHTGERPYQCPHCTYASPDTFKLKRHLRTHTGEKPYECDICRSRFTQSNSLKAHKLIHSVGNKPIFQCSMCPTTCGRKTDLRIHVQKLHTSDKPIICKRCGKSFPDRYNYKVHIKTHEGEKCFKCTLCPYASISQRHLDSHMLIHTDQRPFDCEYCDQSFRQKQLLRRHMNLYHNKDYVPPIPREKKNSCPHCSRTFSHKGNLMRHMTTHDPDSNDYQEKLQLKIGRKTRVETDKDSVGVFDEDCDFLNDDTQDCREEFVEQEEDEDGTIYEVEEQTAVDETDNTILNAFLDGENIRTITSTTKPGKIKKENTNNKDFFAVEGVDGERYVVVEVLQSDDGDDGSEITANGLSKTSHATYTFSNLVSPRKAGNRRTEEMEIGLNEEQMTVTNFGENEDNKSAIQLMHVIE